MQPIDPNLIEIIDALNSQRSCTQSTTRWIGRSADYLKTITEESDYSLSETEAERIAQLPDLLAEVDHQVTLAASGEGNPEELLGASVRFHTRLSELTTDREETFFVPIPQIDKLLCAGKAVLEGRAAPLAVTRRIAPARAEMERIENLFTPHADSFPEEFQQTMERGFKLVETAFKSLEEYRANPGSEKLDQALAKLNQGGRMVANFPVAVREMQRENRRHIPVIGSLLETLEIDPTDEFVALLQNEGVPQLRAFWEEKDDGWLLPPQKAEAILDEVSSALEHFEQCATDYEHAPEQFWASVDALEAGFQKIRDNSMPVQDVLDSSLGPEAALLLSLLEGRAPDFAARTAMEAMRAGDVPDFIDDLANGLEDYLESGDKIVLLEMLEMLLQEI